MDLRGLHLVASVVIFIILHSITGVLSDEVLLSCSFETSCGLEHSSQSQYSWLPNSGPTTTRNTGPPYDHTLQTSSGRYIYAPSSVGRNDRGGRSRLYTPEYRLTSGTGRLEFYYHMWDGYGADEMGSLNVYVCGPNSRAVWTRSGNQGNQWRWTGQVEFTCQTTFRVYIEAIRGRYQSDIAIDDVIITDIFAPTTLFPTTQMVATTTPRKTTMVKIPTTTDKKQPTTTGMVPPPAETPVQIPVQPTETVADPTTPGQQPTGGVVNPTAVLMTKITPVRSRPAGSTALAPTSSGVMENDTLKEKSMGVSNPAFLGPIVVLSVGLIFIGLTLCLAGSRKSCRPSKSSSGKDTSAARGNRQYGAAATGIDMDTLIDGAGGPKKIDGYSYQQLLQQSYSSAEGANGSGENGNTYQDISENILYDAIPETKDGANGYSYVKSPPRKAGHVGVAPSAGSSDWSGGNADQDYEAVGKSDGLVDNQFYIPHKE
ncbi:uncharacterized protein [Asterias amurensis]|uniref:uncharacterized protein n=1 Tax=Asterias amurensis TaxID=7602 RepID=UPI003AB63329